VHECAIKMGFVHLRCLQS